MTGACLNEGHIFQPSINNAKRMPDPESLHGLSQIPQTGRDRFRVSVFDMKNRRPVYGNGKRIFHAEMIHAPAEN